MLGATDSRIDAVVASITWNDLADAFFPQHATAPGSLVDGTGAGAPASVLERGAATGPFKQVWASRFFVSSVASRTAGGTATTSDPTCGRFDPTICRLFLQASATGSPSPQLLQLLRAHSPAPLLAGLHAPTLLIQGMGDSLFGVDQADATARTLAAQGTPVAVRWMDGGHDGPSSTADDDLAVQRTWLDHYIGPATKPAPGSPLPLPSFTFADPLTGRQTVARLEAADAPYARAATYDAVPLTGGTKPLTGPPGGQPSSITLVPGAGAIAAQLPTYLLAALPAQSAAWDTQPSTTTRTVVGAPRVRLTLTSTASSSTLFLSLWQVTGGQATLVRRVVAPVTVPLTPGQPASVDVTLAGGSWVVPPGSSLRVLVTSTDSTYDAPRAARADRVELSDLRLPTVAATPLATGGSGLDTQTWGVLAATGVLLLGFAGLALVRRRRRRSVAPRPELADVPLVVEHLVKTYKDGHRAVDDVSWRAERGQVVGLLGPNGAGKTTTLRMVLGLIRPDSGEVHLLGAPVDAGAAVLDRVGALVEGPGFLPHLSGIDNLRAYWAATGRPEDEAHLPEVLAVAALGGAVERPVRSYSQGMRQRLGIAQAMLGLPELLILDEPTNGLDPPQIAALRPILQRYAAGDGTPEGGRTVVVSSHLLAEVELTCSHVVVMHAGRVVTTGSVADLVDSSDTTVLEVQRRDPYTRDGGPEGTPYDVALAGLRAAAGVVSVEAPEPVEGAEALRRNGSQPVDGAADDVVKLVVHLAPAPRGGRPARRHRRPARRRGEQPQAPRGGLPLGHRGRRRRDADASEDQGERLRTIRAR